MTPRLLLTAFALVLVSSAASASVVIWVAPDGKDDAAGTQAAPFGTLLRARDEVRKIATEGMKDDIIIQLRSGVYRLEAPIEFAATDLGDGKHRVTITSENGVRAVLAGSRPLTGNWRQVKGDLWSLPVPAAAKGAWVFRSLFRAGRSLPRAIEPNKGWFTVVSVADGRRRLQLKESLPAAWHGLQTVEINSTAQWHFNRQPAAALGADFVVGRRPIGTDASGARISDKSKSRVWLENAAEFVDSPGEWFLNTEKGELLYFASPGEDPNHSQFSTPVARELMVVRGTPDKLAKNIHFVGLEFAETDWEMPPDGRLGLQAGGWAYDRNRTYSPSAVLRFIYAENSSVESCVFRDLGDGAVAFEIGARASRVARCEFTRVGANVIQVGRMPEYTGEKHPLHRDFATSRDWLDKLEKLPGFAAMGKRMAEVAPEAPARIEISDNSLIDCCHIDFGSVGIWVGYANNVRIEHNLLRGFPYTAISIGWRWAPGLTNCHSNLVARNRIEGVMRQLGDGAGIYLVGEQPGTRIAENFVSDVGGGPYWGNGLYFDEHSDHMEVTGNYVNRVADLSIAANFNGPNQFFHDNNGQPGPTPTRQAVKFSPERAPPDLSIYGPRNNQERWK